MRSAIETVCCESRLPASDASAPFGMRTAIGGMCSNASGIDSNSTFMGSRRAEGSRLRHPSRFQDKAAVVESGGRRPDIGHTHHRAVTHLLAGGERRHMSWRREHHLDRRAQLEPRRTKQHARLTEVDNLGIHPVVVAGTSIKNRYGNRDALRARMNGPHGTHMIDPFRAESRATVMTARF